MVSDIGSLTHREAAIVPENRISFFEKKLRLRMEFKTGHRFLVNTLASLPRVSGTRFPYVSVPRCYTGDTPKWLS
jgi:hypothetical protein